MSSINERFKETKKIKFPGFTDNTKQVQPSRETQAVGDPAKPLKAAPQMTATQDAPSSSEQPEKVEKNLRTSEIKPQTVRMKKHGRNKSVGASEFKKIEKQANEKASQTHPRNPSNFHFLNELLMEVTLLSEASPNGPN